MLGISGNINFKNNNYINYSYKSKVFNKYIKSQKKISIDNVLIDFVDNEYYGNVHIQNKSMCLVVGNIFDLENKKNISSKSEYLLNIFKNKGSKAACNLNGNYLFFIKENNNFYIGTDSNSYIPFYYSLSNKLFLFSYDISYVKENHNNDLDFNYYSIFSNLLCGGIGLDDNSKIDSIKKLDSGSCIKVNSTQIVKLCDNNFFYLPKYKSIDYHLDNVENELKNSIELRTNNKSEVGVGLSGGLDSRILVTALNKYSDCKIKSHTYGKSNFIEHNIALDISKLLRTEHSKFIVEKEDFIESINKTSLLSSGDCPLMSGPQISVYENISNVDVLMFGSFLDYTAGSSGINTALMKIKTKRKLLEYYEEKYLIKIKKNNFINMFQDVAFAKKIYDYTYNKIKENLDTIEGDNICDINTAFYMRCRGKRWYNNQLLFPLLKHNVSIPFYDLNFLKSISEVPTKFRHNDTFRIRLLRKINLESSNIILSSTMKKANIESPKYNKFKNNILENEKNLYKNYLSSNYSKKFESILNDANFFEWIVKNKKIQNFFIDRLLGRNASLTNKLLNHGIVKKIILNQINGKKNNLRILLLLTTYENFINEMNKL